MLPYPMPTVKCMLEMCINILAIFTGNCLTMWESMLSTPVDFYLLLSMTSIISSVNVGIEMNLGALLFMNSVGLSVDPGNLAERFCPISVKYSLNFLL